MGVGGDSWVYLLCLQNLAASWSVYKDEIINVDGDTEEVVCIRSVYVDENIFFPDNERFYPLVGHLYDEFQLTATCLWCRLSTRTTSRTTSSNFAASKKVMAFSFTTTPPLYRMCHQEERSKSKRVVIIISRLQLVGIGMGPTR